MKKSSPQTSEAQGQLHQGVYQRFQIARERRAAARALRVIGRLNHVLNLAHGTDESLNLLRHASDVAAIDATFDARSSGGICITGIKSNGRRPTVNVGQLELGSGSVECVFCQDVLPNIPSSEERLSLLSEFSRVTSKWLVVSHAVDGHFGGKQGALGSRTSNVISDDLMVFELAKAGFDVVAKIRVVPVIPSYCFYVSRLRCSQ
ncbi:hypothetical protein [Pseudomonas sp. NPDC089401]|uniref:hypothetical protein n=1 Tax=Pseudomonas sp. NPDC089401 TaxID=3364462 RepID=UPI003806111F